MDAETMVLPRFLALTWTRARAIADSPGGWGRFLASVMAAVWAMSLYGNGVADQSSGTAQLVEMLGLDFASLWMLAAAVVPMLALVVGWIPLRVLAALGSLTTWGWLLFEMAVHGHLLHLSAGTCLVGVLACVRADASLAMRIARGRSA